MDRCKEYFSSPVRIVPSHSGENGMSEEFEIERGSTNEDDYHTEIEEETDLGVAEPVDISTATDHCLGQELENQSEADSTAKERRYPSRVRRPNPRYQEFIPWDNVSEGMVEKSSYC